MNEVVDHAAALAAGAASNPPASPLRRVWTRINQGHFLLWAYRGEADVRIGSRALRPQQGEAVWLPTRIPNTIEYAADFIAIPVGDSFAPVCLDVDELNVFSFPGRPKRSCCTPRSSSTACSAPPPIDLRSPKGCSVHSSSRTAPRTRHNAWLAPSNSSPTPCARPPLTHVPSRTGPGPCAPPRADWAKSSGTRPGRPSSAGRHSSG